LVDVSVNEKKLNETAQIAKKGQLDEKKHHEQQYRDTLKKLQTLLDIATDDYKNAITQCDTIAKQNSAPLPASNIEFTPLQEIPPPS